MTLYNIERKLASQEERIRTAKYIVNLTKNCFLSSRDFFFWKD